MVNDMRIAKNIDTGFSEFFELDVDGTIEEFLNGKGFSEMATGLDVIEDVKDIF